MDTKSYPILVFEPHAESRARWVRILLGSGFSPVVVGTREALVQGIISGKFLCALSTVSSGDTTLIQTLKMFRERPEFRHIQFLLALEIAEQQLVIELIKAGFCHIVARAQNDIAFSEKLDKIVIQLGGGPDRRQHVRLAVAEYENAKMILTLPNARKVTSMIRNISIGGLQVAFRERIFVRFTPNEILKDCLMVFKNLDVSTDVRVVSMLDKGLQLQFHMLDETRQNQIAKFVQERIQLEF